MISGAGRRETRGGRKAAVRGGGWGQRNREKGGGGSLMIPETGKEKKFRLAKREGGVPTDHLGTHGPGGPGS